MNKDLLMAHHNLFMVTKRSSRAKRMLEDRLLVLRCERLESRSMLRLKETKELTYRLALAYQKQFEAKYGYCRMAQALKAVRLVF